MCGWGYSFSMLQMFVLLQRWHFAFRRMPTMLIYAKIAAEYGISEDRLRQIIRSTRPPKSPLKPIKGSLKGRYSPDGSGLKINPPVIIGRT